MINERQWKCKAEWNHFGTREELAEKLGFDEGDMIREVEVSVDVDDEFQYRGESYIICGDSLDSIKEKALKFFCAVYHHLLTEVAHSDITVTTLVEGEDDLLDWDFDLEDWDI